MKPAPMRLVSRDELLAELAEGRDIKLLMSLDSWAFQAQHIPGSLHFDSPQDAFATLDVDDDIVVYCAGPNSPASQRAYDQLVQRGYQRVRRYAGGIADWAAAGLPLEGSGS